MILRRQSNHRGNLAFEVARGVSVEELLEDGFLVLGPVSDLHPHVFAVQGVRLRRVGRDMLVR